MSLTALDRARAALENEGLDANTEIRAIQGDASSRCYFRAATSSGTFVLLVESAADGDLLKPFISNAAFLESIDLGPPHILREHLELGVLRLEDLGDVSLRAALEERPNDRVELLERAVDLIAALQERGTKTLTAETNAYHVTFDVPVYRRELLMFRDQYLKARGGWSGTSDDEESLLAALEWLASQLAEDASQLTHRDYHIDNLMLKDDRLRLIDFQDARWGPALYDLASLLNDRDIHRFVDAKLESKLVDRFAAASELPRDAFDRNYCLAVIQRTLKATGTFADQSIRRGKQSYLPYIAPTLARTRRAAAGMPELEPIIKALDQTRHAEEG